MAFDRFGTCSGCAHHESFRNRGGVCRFAGSWAEKSRAACGHECGKESPAEA